MPTDAIRLRKFCQEIEETLHDKLREPHHEPLLGGCACHCWSLSKAFLQRTSGRPI